MGIVGLLIFTGNCRTIDKAFAKRVISRTNILRDSPIIDSISHE
jgi:hypothetical protein